MKITIFGVLLWLGIRTAMAGGFELKPAAALERTQSPAVEQALAEVRR